MLVEYLRDDNNNPIGAVVCTGVDNKGYPKIGWALRNPCEKSYSKELAKKVAAGRAEANGNGHYELRAKSAYYRRKPFNRQKQKEARRIQNLVRLEELADKMRERARRYYKV